MEGGDFLRKAWTTTLIFLALCCLAACANGKAAAIKQMAAAEKGTYSICVFWDGEQTDCQALTMEMVNAVNSEKALKTMNVSNVTFVSLHDKSQKFNYKKLLNIKQSPTVVLLDDRNILLQTADPKEVEAYAEKSRGKVAQTSNSSITNRGDPAVIFR